MIRADDLTLPFSDDSELEELLRRSGGGLGQAGSGGYRTTRMPARRPPALQSRVVYAPGAGPLRAAVARLGGGIAVLDSEAAVAPDPMVGTSIVDDIRDFVEGGGGTGAGDSELAKRVARELIQNVEFQSQITPPVVMTAEQLLSRVGERPDPNAPDKVKELKPTIYFRFKRGLGTRFIAPGGRADPDAWKTTAAKLGIVAGGAVVGTLLLGAVAGYFVGKRRAA